jgi:hypothetical protein
MKIRNGFVSNSSSSSFVINKRFLSSHQIEQIYAHQELAEDNNWIIKEDDFEISGWTFMDNFNMSEYLEKIGINMKFVEWDD